MTLRYRGWQDQALCDGMDPAIFFPERGESNARAKRICARCPVRGECLVTAIHDEPHGKDERHGTAGGLTAKERDRFAKKYGIDSQRPPRDVLIDTTETRGFALTFASSFPDDRQVIEEVNA